MDSLVTAVLGTSWLLQLLRGMFVYELSVYSIISVPLSSFRSNYFFLSFSFGGSAHRRLMKWHMILRNVGLPGFKRKSNSLIESPDLKTKYVHSVWAFNPTDNTFVFFHNCDVLIVLTAWKSKRQRIEGMESLFASLFVRVRSTFLQCHSGVTRKLEPHSSYLFCATVEW